MRRCSGKRWKRRRRGRGPRRRPNSDALRSIGPRTTGRKRGRAAVEKSRHGSRHHCGALTSIDSGTLQEMTKGVQGAKCGVGTSGGGRKHDTTTSTVSAAHKEERLPTNIATIDQRRETKHHRHSGKPRSTPVRPDRRVHRRAPRATPRTVALCSTASNEALHERPSLHPYRLWVAVIGGSLTGGTRLYHRRASLRT